MSDIEIKEICKKYKIKNYTIKDGLVNVDGDVYLYDNGLTELPLKFGEVTGNFNCSNNQLTSLKGSPTKVGGYLKCISNKLTDLQGCPAYVGDYFSASFNELVSIIGSPRYIGNYFSITDNYILNLEGSPDYIGGSLHCSYNKLTDLKGCPDIVNEYCHVDNNDIYSLEGLLFKQIKIGLISDNPIFDLYMKYNLDDVDHREFLIEADVIRPSEVEGGKPIINKARMYWFTQTYGLEEFKGDKNYKLQL